MARQSSSMKVLRGTLEFQGLSFEYERKKLKYLRLKVLSSGVLKLCIPYFCSSDEVFHFLSKNQAWIKDKQARFLALKNELKADECFFLGKKYRLCFDEKLTQTKLYKNHISTKDQALLEEFFYQNAQKIFLAFVKKYQAYFTDKTLKIRIKKMKTRWGSCNHNKAYINLNLALIHKPIKSIEYVILHELTHLQFPHHQKSFYECIYKFMPDYKIRERALKTY